MESKTFGPKGNETSKTNKDGGPDPYLYEVGSNLFISPLKPVGSWSFDEGTGTIANDSSGNNNNGIIYGNPTWTIDGQVNKALSFDGVDDYVRSDNDMLLDSNQSYSVWVYPKATSSLKGVLTTHNHTITSNIGINTHNNKFSISIGYTDGTREYNTKLSNYSIITNIWTHVVLIYNADENSVSFYINGLFDSKWNLTKTVKFTSERILVGQWSNTYLGDYPFNGLLDEARIYNRALSAEEIKRHYEMSK